MFYAMLQKCENALKRCKNALFLQKCRNSTMHIIIIIDVIVIVFVIIIIILL